MKTFFVEGKPQGKGRPRFSKGIVYTPRKTTEYEKTIALEYKWDTLKGGVFVYVTAYFGVPKSYTKAQKRAIESGEALPIKKPDADNIGKIVLDALNGVAYDDDKQVIDLRVLKKYSFEREGLEITIGEAK